MGNTTFVGIDISKDPLDVCITTPDGKDTFATNTEKPSVRCWPQNTLRVRW